MDSAFKNAVEEISTPNYLSTKAELVEYYKDTYGSKGWKQHLVKDLAAQTGMKPKSLERRFDPSRLDNVPRTKREQEQYKQLAREKTPPVSRTLKKDSASFAITGNFPNGRGGTRHRTIGTQGKKITLSGTDLYAWVNNPDFETLFTEYFGDDDGGSAGEYESVSNAEVSVL